MPIPPDAPSSWIVPPGLVLQRFNRFGTALTRDFARRPRPWLIAAAIVIFLLPLFRESWFAIPWPVRKTLGGAYFLFLVTAGVGRLLWVRPSDDRVPNDRPFGRSDWWCMLALFLICATLAIPLLHDPTMMGFGDWDYFLGKAEAVRRTIIDWGEFPFWDPWTCGGFPLAANPGCGLAGVGTPFVLGFGTLVGMQLATVHCFALAAEGTRRLARLWVGDPLAALAAGLIYAINGGVTVSAVSGYHMVMSYQSLPWLLYYTFRLERRPADGLWLGVWTAFSILNGIQYFTVYAVMITSVATVRALRARPLRGRFLGHLALAIGVFFALAGWRVATMLVVYRDFPRLAVPVSDESPWSMLHHLLNRPSASMVMKLSMIPYFWETTCYIGPVALGLAAVSLAWGWRWWHTLALVSFWLGLGGVHWFQPSYWLRSFPLFATMHAVTRWRIMALLGLALAAASTLEVLSRKPKFRWLAVVATLALVVDYVQCGFEMLPLAFSVPPADRLPSPLLPRNEIVQLGTVGAYPAISRGYGAIEGFEPLISYDRHTKTERRHRGETGYKGEFWQGDKLITPISWSPNRIVLQIGPNEDVSINQNPGSSWWINGRPAFPNLRCAEREVPFVAHADANGRIVLEHWPKGLTLGLMLHAVALAALTPVSLVALARRRHSTFGEPLPTPSADSTPVAG